MKEFRSTTIPLYIHTHIYNTYIYTYIYIYIISQMIGNDGDLPIVGVKQGQQEATKYGDTVYYMKYRDRRGM